MASISNPSSTPSHLLLPLLFFLFLSLSSGTRATSHSETSHAHARAPAPAPAATQDCTAYLSDLIDCIDFVQQGSNSTKPTASCCAGLKKVVRENVRCLCEGLQNSKDYGINLNISRAEALPSACGVSTPGSSACKISGAPAPAPVAGSTGVAAVPFPPPGSSLAMGLQVSALIATMGIAISIFLLIDSMLI
ncbi:Bifunctional inhibitor/lipid-transfer protein/seed storage 2S albumin superfamily protein [Rhynchospora pubera]|uniref:Bifunctional inhibitor/lipid-transfer protein/seed storage 2S albumin superfamily protein n=1 Tax=Rhynchospora pubera TaxID=906938 RepID=A0AAV8HII3_9POAL|nr:Bifunctional inhibitor/lipid-transfer protein/seed storage 2S albumin superfamily protein [Rhynchospora pubera]